jgi:phage terminase small subunit
MPNGNKSAPIALEASGAPESDRPLTEKERLFVEEYVKDFNASRAARVAKYGSTPTSTRKAASHLLTKGHIRAAVGAHFAKRKRRFKNEEERILNELRSIAYSNMKDLAQWDSGGVTFKNSDDVARRVTAAVSEVSDSVNESGTSVRLKKHDKIKALELLGRHFGMFWKEADDGFGKDKGARGSHFDRVRESLLRVRKR